MCGYDMLLAKNSVLQMLWVCDYPPVMEIQLNRNTHVYFNLWINNNIISKRTVLCADVFR